MRGSRQDLIIGSKVRQRHVPLRQVLFTKKEAKEFARRVGIIKLNNKNKGK